MGDNMGVKISRIKILKPHIFLIIGRKSTKFQVNPMKNVGVADTRSFGRMDGRKDGRTKGRPEGRTDGRTDGITHTWTDEGHFYSPPPPTSGDKNAVLTKNHNFLKFPDCNS